MGNSPLSREFTGWRLSSEERKATKRFDKDEMRLLRETFKGLTTAKNGVSIDKETFLKCFPMRGLLGERLFDATDKDGSGSIHYNEFVYGLAILFKGSRMEKLKFIFDLCDLSSAGSVSRHELMTMLHQFPESALEYIEPKTEYEESKNSPETSTPSRVMEKIEALVGLAFPSSRSSSTCLSYEQFYHWCELTPGITDFVMSVLPDEDYAVRDDTLSLHGIDASLLTSAYRSRLHGEREEVRLIRNSFAKMHVDHSAAKANAIPSGDGSPRKEFKKTRALLQEAKKHLQC